MGRIRSRLTYANVMATILAFIVLGGGSALASLVITSNSQVAANTISGHKPPSGDRANVIAGSLNGQDLAGSSVNSAKVADNSLTGADINERSLGLVTSFRSSQTASDSTDDDTPVNSAPTTVMNVGNVTLTATCQSNYAQALHPSNGSLIQWEGLKIVVSSPTAGAINWGNDWAESGHEDPWYTPNDSTKPGMISPDEGHTGGAGAFSATVLDYWKGLGLRGVLTLVDDDTANNRGETVQLTYETYPDSPSGDAICREWGTVQRSPIGN
jgi:hypothetical protein